MSKLTPKQENFCQVYVQTGNATEAFKRSYSTIKYKPKSINEKASQFLVDVKIKSRIDELRAKIESESIMTASEIQQFWTVTIKDEEQDMKDRIKCTDLLGKCIGIFEKDNHQKGEALSKCYLPLKDKDN